MADGRLVWLALNIDRAENGGFVEDFQLDTSTLVVADIRSGKCVRWKKLARVWELIGDEAAFTQYVQDEISRYLQSE
ncbi:MAG TPA: hypothetical protein HPP51_04765, partial [Planctomycetes bacterium]|nr:hypothetical protein [Planctomycetota bacterium]